MSEENINIADVLNLAVIGMLPLILDEYPLFKKMFVESGSNSNDWDFFMTAAGCGVVLMSSESFEGEHNQIMTRLIETDKGFPKAIEDFAKFMNNKELPDDLIMPMAGQWVLWNIKKSEPTEEETMQLAGGLGAILFKVIRDNRQVVI